MKSWIHVEFMGGIGNQLFQYFAALNTSNVTRIPVITSNQNLRNYKWQHQNSEIFSLAPIEGSRARHSRIGIFSLWLSKIIFAGLRRSTLLTRVAACRGFITDPYLTRYPLPSPTLKKFHFKGYFQTYKNFDSCLPRQKNLFIGSPSAWYCNLEALISGRTAAAVHIRRGDYLSVADTFGILSKGYYERAIKFVLSKHPNVDFFVFSDDNSAAREIMRGIDGPQLTFIEPSDSASAAESLVLMSKCQIVITANSTFSYWGAMLGKEKKLVVCPSPWLRSPKLHAPEIPGSWVELTSEFIP